MLAGGLFDNRHAVLPEQVAKLQVPDLFLARQFRTKLSAWLVFSIILLWGFTVQVLPCSTGRASNKLEQWLPNKTSKMAVSVILGIVAFRHCSWFQQTHWLPCIRFWEAD